MFESINTFIEPLFRQVVIASGITSLFSILSFSTIKLLRTRNPILIYNTYLITLFSFLVIPLIALILAAAPINKPHFDFKPISFQVEPPTTIIQEHSLGIEQAV